MRHLGGGGRKTFHMVTSCTIGTKRFPRCLPKLPDSVPTSNYRILVRRVGFEPTNPSSSSGLDSKGRDLSAKFSPTYLSPSPLTGLGYLRKPAISSSP